MSEKPDLDEFLVLSRGQWDASATPARIQAAIDAFYDWHDRLVAEGRMVSGERLAPEGRRVSRDGVTDGPYAEAKEVIGGYWFLRAADLDGAARLAAENPCLAVGLTVDVRPLERRRCSAYDQTCETPRLSRDRS